MYRYLLSIFYWHKDILLMTLISLVFSCIFSCVIFLICYYEMKKSAISDKTQVSWLCAFCIYIVCIYMLTLGCRTQHDSMQYSFKIRNYFDVENIVLFVPCGMLLSSFSRKNAILSVLYSALISLLIELLQLIAKLGSFELMDIVFNVMGSLIGMIILQRYLHNQRLDQ